MRWKSLLRGGLIVLAILLGAIPATAQDAAARKQDEQAIRAAATAYQEALTKGDAKALAEFWTTDADFIDGQGNIHPSAELLAEAGTAAAEAARPENKVTSSKIRFLAGDVAIEEGTSEIVYPDAQDEPPVRGHFHVIWVKQDGHWRMASLCEIPNGPSADPQLAELGWMVGRWAADSGDVKLEMTAQWNATGTFLLRDLKATRDGKVLLRGSQRIGLDPLTRKLKSWNFDSDGGHSESTWTKDGDSWVGQSIGVLADGRQTSDTSIVTFDGKNSFTRKSLAGRVQGEPVPDNEVRFTRQAEPAK